MNKNISEGDIAMESIMKGVNLVANPVKSTLGLLGRTVIISKGEVGNYQINDFPLEVSKDGYKVGLSISAEDRQVQVGVLFIQEVLKKQMELAGDATTTAALLTQAILEGGLKLIKDGVSHVVVKEGIMKAVKYIVEELRKMSTPINGKKDLIQQVATVCSNNDSELGDLIAEAFEKIGDDGVIDLEESKGINTTIKISAGMKFPLGWNSQYFVTNKAKAECILEEPYILLYDKPISKLHDTEGGSGIMPILERVLAKQQATGIKRPLMILCDDCDNEALATLTFNTQQGGLQSCVVETKFLGEHKKTFMEDLAILTGGTLISELKGIKLSNVELEHLGQAKKIIVGKEETVVIEGLKDEIIFNNLVDDIKKLIESEEDKEQQRLLKKRLARLTGSIATLSIGGTTEVEMKERFDRADDAVRSTSSAIEQGFIPGGGSCFYSISKEWQHTFGKEETINTIMCGVLVKPLIQICENAGVDYNLVSSKITKRLGYNAKTGEVEDLVKSGIIEPTKSNICALQNAASVVCTILTSKYLITDIL